MATTKKRTSKKTLEISFEEGFINGFLDRQKNIITDTVFSKIISKIKSGDSIVGYTEIMSLVDESSLDPYEVEHSKMFILNIPEPVEPVERVKTVEPTLVTDTVVK